MIKTITSLAGRYLNALAYIMPQTAGHQGFRLFCRPFRTPLSDYHKKFLATADQFTFEHDGVTIQTYRWGNGSKKILFIHGWQSHSFRWKAYIDAFSKDEYTLYAIDAPGHGLSGGSFLTVPYYSAAIQQLIVSLGNIYAVVGHSLGSFTTLHMLYEQPKLPIKKLVLMAPPGEANDFLLFYKKTLKLSDRTSGLIRQYFEKVLNHSVSFYSTTRFTTGLSIPGLIIHDEGDQETPYHYARSINKQWNNSKLITTKDLGHNLKSPEVVQEIIKFVNTPVTKAVMEVHGVSNKDL